MSHSSVTEKKSSFSSLEDLYDVIADATPTPTRFAVVDQKAIAHNLALIKNSLKDSHLLTVVKANAYGHGLIQVARTAWDNGADQLGVADIAEALEIRQALPEAKILAWLHTPFSDFKNAIESDIELGASGDEIDLIAQAAREVGKSAIVHLKVDTGMGRNGTSLARWEEIVTRALAYRDEGLMTLRGIFSHFATADEPERQDTIDQNNIFDKALDQARQLGLEVPVVHMANSPATLSNPEAYRDMVRVGLASYGLSPFPPHLAGVKNSESILGQELIPAMTLGAYISSVKDVSAGQGVSYGLRYATEQATRLALVPLGYADGLPRILSGGKVFIKEQQYNVVGTVSMDQIVVDLGPESDVSPGDIAFIFGDPGLDTAIPSAQLWAEAAGTISYSILTGIGPRVKRIYTSGSQT